MSNDNAEISNGYDTKSHHSMNGFSDNEQAKSECQLYNVAKVCMTIKLFVDPKHLWKRNNQEPL